MAELPVPQTSRWQPLRLGLVDLFYYDDEVFPFVDGRLLLRGNNGTGKSKVLALTLPFLLDGDLAARRVEPDADPNKRMEWNLLLGGAHQNPERLGYTWVEFGRIAEDGEPRFCTLGAGLKAAQGRGMVRHWFFVTSQRVGDDLELVDATRTALSRERLVEALDVHGRVYDVKRDYRRAVDEWLFGLGERRYDALVDLLIQLRQPQLSKKPNERALSDALTESLTPVRADLIDYVAEGFRGLDEEREQLEQLTDTARSAEAFLEHYRRYAKVVSRRRAAGPRQAQSNYEQLGRDLLRVQEELSEAHEAAEAVDAELETLRRRASALDAEYEVLMDGEHAEAEAALNGAQREAEGARTRAESAKTDLENAARELADADQTLTTAKAEADDARRGREQAATDAHEAARPAGLADEHTRVVADLDLNVESVKKASDDVLRRRRQALARVREVIELTERAEQALTAAKRWLDEMTSLHDGAATRHSEAETHRDEAGERLVADVRAHLDAVVELRLDAVATVLDDLQEWTARLDGPNPAAQALAGAAEHVRAELSEARARARARDDELATEAADLEQEIAGLEDGRTQPPPARHTRGDDLPGLPVWQSVEFTEGSHGLADTERAGLEAALEAAGLLDAHILPGGEVRSAADGEVLVTPQPLATTSARSPGTLADVLRPELPPDPAGVRPEDVARVLASIAILPAGRSADGQLERAESWVSPDGRFRLGVTTGAWTKPEASYIGEGAREAARQRRLAEARVELDAVVAERSSIAQEITHLDERTTLVRRERDAMPSETAVRDAHAAVRSAHQAVVEATAKRDSASSTVDDARTAVDRQKAELAEEATALALPTVRAELDQAQSATDRYATTLLSLWHAVDLAAREARRLASVQAERARAAERHDAAETRKRTCDDERSAAEARLQTLESTVGAEVREFQERRATVKAAKADTESATTQAHHRLSDARARTARAEEREQQALEQQKQAAAAREQAIGAIRRTAGRGLLAVACPGTAVPDPTTEWTITEAVTLSRAVEQELSEIDADDAAYERAYSRLGPEVTNLQTALSRHGHSVIVDPNDDGYTVSVVFGGKTTPVADLAVTLRDDIEARERLLGAREREIIENHLVTEVGANLADLVAEGESQVVTLNAELADRPTSTGMKLRVTWRARRDGPAGLTEARQRLRQLSDAWSPEDRTEIGTFLQARISEAREADETGTWHEHLERALDYRSWHEFTVERYQNGAWRSATGPASGGERVLAVSVPLFAAASSHYQTATKPHGARLVMLDEAFAGVDDDSRAKSLGLLHAFDLDVVMTSEREWGCYPEVPGLSIAQLARVEDIPAVLVTLWEWDGHTRTQVRSAGLAGDLEPTDGVLA